MTVYAATTITTTITTSTTTNNNINIILITKVTVIITTIINQSNACLWRSKMAQNLPLFGSYAVNSVFGVFSAAGSCR